MPGRIVYNGINIDFQNEWARFNPRLASNASTVPAMSGVSQTVQLFEQEFISTQIRLAPGQDEIQLQRFFEYANDGSTFELWRDKNLGTYISFEGGGNSATVPTITPRGLLTNDKVAGTFTRTNVTDSAWFLDPSTGLLTVANTANAPRFVAGKYGQHAILMEAAATNLIEAPSGPFDSVNWVASGGTFSTNTAETLDPAGTNIADKILTTGANQTIHYNSGTTVNIDAAVGIWLKSSSGSQSVDLTIEGTGGGVSSETRITVIPEWRRFSMTADTSGFTTNLRFRVQFVPNATIFYMYGAVMSMGVGGFKFDPGTIGPTQTSSSITRNADVGPKWASVNIVNKLKGSVAGWVKPGWDLGNLSNDGVLYHCGDTAAGEPHSQIQFILGSDTLRVTMRKDNDGTVAVTHNVALTGLLTKDTWHHWGFTYDATISNGMKTYWDGALIGTSTNDPFNISEIGDDFAIGNLVDAATNSVFGAIDEVIIMKDVKPASWFQQIFSRTKAIGEGRNYWSSVRLANLNYVRQALRGGRSTIPLEFEEVLS